MKRSMTMSFGWIAIGAAALLSTPSAWAQAGGAGGEAGETAAAAGLGGATPTPGGEPVAGASAEPGSGGAETGGVGSGGAAEAGAGGAPDPVILPPNDYDLLENDGGRACSIGGTGSAPGAIAVVLGAAFSASILRRRKRG
jgi:MYXO-CTERM domain-containing protein